MTMPVQQKTIAGEVSFSGRALQGGKETTITCKPAPPESGIVFSRVDLPHRPSSRIGTVFMGDSPQRRSTVELEGASVETVEHFLAALWALGINNILVEVNGKELPAMDGSAIEFLKKLKQTGTTEQAEFCRVINIKKPIQVGDSEKSIKISPADALNISYFIDYDCPSIGSEKFEIELNEDSFEGEIAPARTFCLKKEAEALLQAGLGQGATCENTLVMDNEGPVGTQLRFPNEPVRHKILDLVGDLYLLGVPVVGKIEARKSGHKLNAMLVKKIYEEYTKETK